MEGMATEPAIGTRIKRARERKRWTQRHLAELIGVSQKTIDNWENGRTEPKSSIGALEEVLGVSLDGTPDPGPEISGELLRAIMSEDGLTPRERQAVIDAVRETLATERGAAGPSGKASG
jgi:transcriptional regulator with XRE-family HTH domain